MSRVWHLRVIGLFLLPSAMLCGSDSGVYMADVAKDDMLSLPASVTAATERLRLKDWTQQRQQVAQSRRELGAAWLGDAPRLGGSWRDYDWNNGSDLYEAELYLTMPLWRIGERKAIRAAAEKDTTLAALQTQARTLATAAEVRRAYWQLLDARTGVELLQRLLAGAERYAQQMTAQFEAGDVARTELLQSRQQVFEFRSQVLDAESMLIDSSRRWRLVTGLDAMPADAVEQASTIAVITEQHPLMQLAMAEVDLLRAEVEASRKTGSLRPEVSLSLKRENFDDLAPPLDSIGIGIDIPLGRGKSNAVAVSRVQQRLLEAEVALQLLQRELQENLHEVRHQAHVNESNLEDSQQLVEIAQQLYTMQKLANEQGEITVIEVLRAAQDLAEAQQRYTLLSLTRDALVARYNQAVGVLPQ
jgi:cobalt-zinc-cadmium efflux system outer membrane protein